MKKKISLLFSVVLAVCLAVNSVAASPQKAMDTLDAALVKLQKADSLNLAAAAKVVYYEGGGYAEESQVTLKVVGAKSVNPQMVFKVYYSDESEDVTYYKDGYSYNHSYRSKYKYEESANWQETICLPLDLMLSEPRVRGDIQDTISLEKDGDGTVIRFKLTPATMRALNEEGLYDIGLDDANFGNTSFVVRLTKDGAVDTISFGLASKDSYFGKVKLYYKLEVRSVDTLKSITFPDDLDTY